jgi:hypothetical protein
MLQDTTIVWGVNYYRCRACEHVWTTSAESGAILHHVTPLYGNRRKWTEEFSRFEES